jgi:hypothetical protein
MWCVHIHCSQLQCVLSYICKMSIFILISIEFVGGASLHYGKYMRDRGCFRPGCGGEYFELSGRKKKQGIGENCVMNSFVICVVCCSVNIVWMKSV